MKTLLICPSRRPAIPHLSAFGPLATTPVFGDSIICYWIEHLAALGAREVQIVASDGADQVRAAVGDGARWGVRTSVVASAVEPARGEAALQYRSGNGNGWLPAPDDINHLSHLPNRPAMPLYESYASWFAALVDWMPLALTPTRVRVKETQPGVWVGSRARVSPMAKLVAPCWVGDKVFVEAGAEVGPGAIIEDRSIVAGVARVTQGWVGPDTFVGPMTSVANSLAWGSTLVNWQTDSALQVPDPFLLSSLTKLKTPEATGRFGRALVEKGWAGSHSHLIDELRARVGNAPG
jgi:hypothetical protein